MKNGILHNDVAIMGAGLVGLAAAVALHQAGFSVVLVDNKNPMRTGVEDDSWDSRIYTISPKNAQWLSSIGAWQFMNPSRIGEMQAMEIFGDMQQNPLTLSASDANADNLGYILESKALMQGLLKKVNSLGIQTIFDSPCKAVSADSSMATLLFENHRTLECSLLLAADGCHSWVRQQLKIPMQNRPYKQTAVVANFKAEKSHGNIARQWFANDEEGQNSILAWLPLPGNIISIVWSVPTIHANALLTLDESDFTKKVVAAGNEKLGALKLISDVTGFPLSLQKTNTLVQDCVVLIGDAAHQIHPMAGQGVNLGFRDVVDLVEVLKAKNQYQSINDSSLLKSYTRVRKVDILKMVLLTEGLYRLFESQNLIIRKARNWGLSAIKQREMKKLLVANAIAL